jgi:hypothetical protein
MPIHRSTTMPTAFIARAADVRFPPKCIACDGEPDAMQALELRRGVDLLFVAYWQFAELSAPICRRCKRRRRNAGAAAFTLVLLFVLGGGFAAAELALNDHQTAAGTLAAAIVIVALVWRFRGDALIDWTTLGIRSAWLKGDGVPLRLTFRRDEYFSAWRAANPDASASPAPAQQRKPKEETPMNLPTFSRAIPAGTLGVSLVLLALHHWNAVANGSVYASGVLLLTMLGGLALGGTIYPPLFFSVGKFGLHLPSYLKWLAGACAAAGLVAGFYLLFAVY